MLDVRIMCDNPFQTENRRVTIRTRREADGLIRFEIMDNGMGMSADVQEKLFSSFFSTKGHLGTGLGLMVTRKLIEEDHGSIEVDSTPGEGTTVTVRLPFEMANAR